MLIISITILVFIYRKSLASSSLSRNQINEAMSEKTYRDEQLKFIQIGCAEKISLQFQEWNLTNAEKEVAALIIMGSCVKNISRIRNVSQNTIKEQCSSIYRKANISGRNELSTFVINKVLDKYLLKCFATASS